MCYLLTSQPSLLASAFVHINHGLAPIQHAMVWLIPPAKLLLIGGGVAPAHESRQIGNVNLATDPILTHEKRVDVWSRRISLSSGSYRCS